MGFLGQKNIGLLDELLPYKKTPTFVGAYLILLDEMLYTSGSSALYETRVDPVQGELRTI